MLSGFFSTTGVILVFLPRWLEEERGLDGAAIGAILALAPLARLFIGPAIALWADSVADRRVPLQLMSAATLVAFAAFFFLAHDFWSLLVLGFVALSLLQTVTPVVELPKATPAREVGPADVLIVSIGLVGVMALIALAAGLLIGGLFILRRRAEDRRDGAEEPEATRLRLSEPPSGTP